MNWQRQCHGIVIATHLGTDTTRLCASISLMSKIAIIPARGGSKRIPGKNIKRFHGRPILAYAIDAAKKSGLFDSIVVSTDSREISQVATESGAEVPFIRTAGNADDHVGMALPVLETLERLNKVGRAYESVCCLFATGPFITSELIVNGYQKLNEDDVDSVIAVQKNPHPVNRSLTVTDSGRVNMLWEEYRLTRSQDLQDTYHDAAQMYWVRTPEFLEQRTFMMRSSAAIVLGELDAHDIDTPEDWCIAEKLWQFNNDTRTAE